MKLFKYSILYLVLLSITFLLSSCDNVSSYDRGNASSYDWSNWYGYDESCKTFYASHGDFDAKKITDMAAAFNFCRTTEYKYFEEVTFNESGLNYGYANMIKCCKLD